MTSCKPVSWRSIIVKEKLTSKQGVREPLGIARGRRKIKVQAAQPSVPSCPTPPWLSAQPCASRLGVVTQGMVILNLL